MQQSSAVLPNFQLQSSTHVTKSVSVQDFGADMSVSTALHESQFVSDPFSFRRYADLPFVCTFHILWPELFLAQLVNGTDMLDVSQQCHYSKYNAKRLGVVEGRFILSRL
jgi:hypothetical protein